MSRAHGFAAGFAACLAASFGAIWAVAEFQAYPRPAGPAVVRVLLVETAPAIDSGVRFELDGRAAFAAFAAGFGAGGGGVEEIGPWSAPAGKAILRATVPGGSVERPLDLAPGPCRVVAVRLGNAVDISPCLEPVARRE